MATTPADAVAIDRESLRQAPKVFLHDHLDGGLRPATVIELADEHGYDGLPTTSRRAGAAGSTGADRGDLVLLPRGLQPHRRR